MNLPDKTINPLETGSQECLGKPSKIAGRTTDVQTAPAPLVSRW